MKLATGAGLDRCYKSAMFLALPGLLGARSRETTSFPYPFCSVALQWDVRIVRILDFAL